MVHGDDAEAHRRRSFCVSTFASAVTRGSPWDTKYLMYCMDNSVSTDASFEGLDQWVVWSLMELAEGEFMTVDPFGNRIDRKGLKGKIAGPYRGVFFCMKADEKYIQKSMHLVNSWNSKGMCGYCKASLEAGPLQYTCFGPNAGHRQTMLSTEDFMTQACRPGPWLRLPGFDVRMVALDWLHIMDLTVIPDCAASDPCNKI